jgi:periplasmic protein TonB
VFEQTFVNTRAQTRRPWTVAASLALQTGLVAIAFVAPLLHVAALRRPESVPVWLPLQVMKQQAPEPAAKPMPRSAPINRPAFRLAPLHAPTTVPSHIDITPDAPEVGVMPAGAPTGPSIFALLPKATIQPAPAPVVKAPQPSISAPVHISGGVQSAKLVFGPKPSYPALARTARIQGTVRIQAIIGRDGSIRNLQVVSGPPLLIEVAKEAVQQWRYQPTLLNGEAVEVITEIEVNFTIGQ